MELTGKSLLPGSSSATLSKDEYIVKKTIDYFTESLGKGKKKKENTDTTYSGCPYL